METNFKPKEISKWPICCRLCLSLEGKFDSFHSNIDGDLSVYIKNCLGILIEPSEILPNKLCSECLQKIHSWHKFKKTCLENDIYLKTQIRELNSACATVKVINATTIPHFSGYYQAVPAIHTAVQDDLNSFAYVMDVDMGSIVQSIAVMTDTNPVPESNDLVVASNQNNEILTGTEYGLKIKSESSLFTESNENMDIKMEPDDSICSSDTMSNEDILTNESRLYNLRPRNSTFQYFHDDEFEEITSWKCENCCSYFLSRSLLTSHISNDDCSGNREKYPCYICNKSFHCIESFARHNLLHLELNFKISVNDLSCCRVCDKSFADSKRFKDHMKQHTANPIITEFRCSLCVERFYCEDLLYDHRFAVHAILDKRISCAICALKFRQKSDLDEHSKIHNKKMVARKRTGLQNFPCSQCPLAFESKEALEKHNKCKHPLYYCRKCQHPCSTRSALLMHYNTHRDDIPKVRNSKIISENEVENPKSCKYCSVEFKFKSDYDVHYSLHIKKKDFKCEVISNSPINFYCSVCPQLFINEEDGAEHIALHHPKDESVKILILKHPTVRSMENLFFCDICKTEMKNKASLLFHMKIVHKYS